MSIVTAIKSVIAEILDYYSAIAEIAKNPGLIPSREKKRFLRQAKRLNIYRILFQPKAGANQIADFGSLKIAYSNPAQFSYNLIEVFVREEYFFRFDTDAPVIVDCGSNIGLATLYFKRVFPGAQITAIEANPETFSVLKSNVETNRLESVNLINTALVSDDRETVEIYSQGAGDLRSTIEPKLRIGDSGISRTTVSATRLSMLLPKHVDLLKIDVEGMEVELLGEIWERLDSVDQIIFEYHWVRGKRTKSLGVLLSELESQGFDCRVILADKSALRLTFREDSYAVLIAAKRVFPQPDNSG